MINYPQVQLDCGDRPFDEDRGSMHWTVEGENERMKGEERKGEKWREGRHGEERGGGRREGGWG